MDGVALPTGDGDGNGDGDGGFVCEYDNGDDSLLVGKKIQKETKKLER